MSPLSLQVQGVTVQALGDYHGPVGRAIKAVKLRGQRAVGRELVDMALQRITELWSGEEVDAVMGLPPSQEGLRYRGFSLPKLLEDQICRSLEWQPLPHAERERFQVLYRSSRGLSAQERQERSLFGNRTDEMIAVKQERRGSLVLIDDVLTTGTTMGQAIQTARTLSYERILAFCLACSQAQGDSDPGAS